MEDVLRVHVADGVTDLSHEVDALALGQHVVVADDAFEQLATTHAVQQQSHKCLSPAAIAYISRRVKFFMAIKHLGHPGHQRHAFHATDRQTDEQTNRPTLPSRKANTSE